MPIPLNPFGEQKYTPLYLDRRVIPTSRVLTLNSNPFELIAPTPGVMTVIKFAQVIKRAGVGYALNGNTNLTFRFRGADGTPATGFNLTITNILNQNSECAILQEYNASAFGGYFGGSVYTPTSNTQVGNSWDVRLATADMPSGEGDLELTYIWRAYNILPSII